MLKIVPTDRFKTSRNRLRTDNERKRVVMLIDHYSKGTRLSGTDKESGGVYAGKNIRHFHLGEPDTLLIYQITKDQLILLAIGTHIEFFGDNEASFLESVKDDLVEDVRYSTMDMRYATILIESLNQTIH
jgi:mRNA-degrading endonuclease YafQ of YafQ-DinJ toxin-antitoxin module